MKSESIGLTEGKKQDLMKKLGPKKRFLSVEEREEEILSRVDPGVRGKLKELVDEFKDIFPDTLPKGRPPKKGHRSRDSHRGGRETPKSATIPARAS